MFCQVCGVTAQQERLQAEIPWDLYVVVIALAIVVIFLWEMSKTCVRGGDVRLRALRARAGYGRMSRNELKELQRLLALEPRDLTDAQGARLLYLKDMFETTMPANTSPVPTLPPEMSSHSSSSTAPPPVRPRPSTRDQGVQKDYQPAFERVRPEPIPEVRIETFAGPYHHVPGTDVLHIHGTCWGLRNTGRAQALRLCRCCVENGGRSLYNR